MIPQTMRGTTIDRTATWVIHGPTAGSMPVDRSGIDDEANARLIAAAPELLAALDALLVVTESSSIFGAGEVLNARAIVSRVRGPR